MRERAIAIFTELAEAEAAVHGVAVDEVHFHELADWDSVADIVGAASLIEALAPVRLVGRRCRSVAAGSRPAMVPCPSQHPPPARLLQGFALHDDGIAGERVTPTGAAILRHLRPESRLPPGAWRLRPPAAASAPGASPGISNVLRVLAYQQDGGWRQDEQVAVLAFEVDDQSAEALAVGLEALRATDGVLDVVQLPAFGKKGRLATQVQVLARPERLDAVIERCFVETTTIGLRWRIEARAVLAREVVTVAAPTARSRSRW